jgi:C4-dicarboxylate transporter DctM subunit
VTSDVIVSIFLVLAVFTVLILAEAPIALCLGGSAMAGILAIDGFSNAASVLGSVFYNSSSRYALFVIPMYILLGGLIANAGIGEKIYRTVHRLVGWLPGGLAASAVGATALFSGISGSSAADVATLGRISVNEMSRHGYSKAYAAAVVAAAGTFANLIPPSLGIVVYGLLAEESIGRLIMAAIVPGVLSAIGLATFVVVRAATSSADAGRGGRRMSLPDEAPARVEARASVAADLVGVVYAAIIFAIVVGGLYGGFFTATEAGAVGAFAALLIMFISRTAGQTRRQILGTSLRETAEVSSMIFLLLAGGAMLSYFMATSGIAANLAGWVIDLPVPPKVTIALILLIILPIGMVLEGLSILLLMVPLVAPVAVELGFDGVWFGILVLKVAEIGLITPPLGLNVFIISGVSRVAPASVFSQIRAFVVLDLAITTAFFLFPDLVLWLPSVAGY